MASNVFGNPITNATLQGMPEYFGKTIRRVDRARVALDMKNAAEKDFNARQYVENLRENWGNGVATLCLIYNATGDTVRLMATQNWSGHSAPAPTPVMMANGQWGAFLHVQSGGNDSSGAVVYRGLNDAGVSSDWMVAWLNPKNRECNRNNQAYNKIEAQGYFVNKWKDIYEQLYDNGLFNRAEWNGCLSTVITGNHKHPIFEALLKLKDP